jgi:hypothetical protein
MQRNRFAVMSSVCNGTAGQYVRSAHPIVPGFCCVLDNDQIGGHSEGSYQEYHDRYTFSLDPPIDFWSHLWQVWVIGGNFALIIVW